MSCPPWPDWIRTVCRWGYEIRSEILWIKTNQLQRLIRTGRTGHWLNHSKEHCIIGIKGNPQLNRNLDCDVIVAEVHSGCHCRGSLSCCSVHERGACRCERRAASPMRSTRCWYTLSLPLCPQCGVLDWQDRLIPGSRKLEIFGRQHNTQPGWITLGNQLDGIRLADPDVIARVSLIELPAAAAGRLTCWLLSTEKPTPAKILLWWSVWTNRPLSRPRWQPCPRLRSQQLLLRVPVPLRALLLAALGPLGIEWCMWNLLSLRVAGCRTHGEMQRQTAQERISRSD